MKNEIVKSNNQVQSQAEFKISNDEIKKYICPTANDQEIYIFKKKCETLNLNPFLGEIYLVKYGGAKAQHIVNYLTYVQRAEQTGLLDGYNVQVSEDGKTATCTIYRKDWSHPFSKTIYRDEFDKKQSTWKDMPRYMLEKVAITCAFRQCFTLNELPYTNEEIGVYKDDPFSQVENKPIFKEIKKQPQKEVVENKEDEQIKNVVDAEIIEESDVDVQNNEEIVTITAKDIITELENESEERKKQVQIYFESHPLNANLEARIEKNPEKFKEAISKVKVD